MSLASRLRLFIGVVLAASFFQASTSAQTTAALTGQEFKQGFLNGRLIAKPKATSKSGDLADQEGHIGMHLKHAINGHVSLRVLEFSKTVDVRQTAAKLKASGLYEYVEPDFIRHATATPNDPQFGTQWNLSTGGGINAEAAWDLRHDAPNVIVAIIDSGLRPTHEDLAGNLWVNPQPASDGFANDLNGINTMVTKGSGSDGDISDNEGHGTAVASVVGAVGNNGKGISGVAWKVQLMPLKFNDATEVATTSNEIICINYAIAKGAKIINFSYGGPEYSQSEYDAIKAARDAGVIFVAAAGNDGAPTELIRGYPASFLLDNIVSVANNDTTGTVVGSSNYGGLVDLAAPGTDVPVCTKDGDSSYGTMSGTSFSAPTVSGALALLAAQYPTDNYRQLINRLLRGVTTSANNAGSVTTSGRLDLNSALRGTSNLPFNDNFANAAPLPQYYGFTKASSKGATAEANEPMHGATGGASIWFTWTAPESGPAYADTLASDFDTTIAVYTGSSLNALTKIGSNDDAPGRTTSRVSFTATQGTTYYIAVDGKNGATGEVGLAVDYVPSNDNFANALDVTSIISSSTVWGSTRFATSESGEPSVSQDSYTAAGNSLWYRWTAPTGGVRTVSSFSGSIESLVGVYTGTTLANLTQVTTGVESATFQATANTQYYIKVDSGNGQLGVFSLALDSFSNATPLATQIYSSPSIDSAGNLAAIDAASVIAYLTPSLGSGSWENQLFQGSVSFNSPTFRSDGSFYVTSTTGFYNVSPAQSINWSKTYAGTSGSSASVAIAADGTVYVHSDDGVLHAYTSHGYERWTASVPGSGSSSPSIAADGTIYIGSENHFLYAIRPLDGSVAWTFDAGDMIEASPAIDASGQIYFGTLGKLFYCLKPDGTQVYSFTAGDEIYSSAAITANGRAVFGGTDGNLYELTSTGTSAFTYSVGSAIYSTPALLSDGSIVFGANDGKFYQISSAGVLVQNWTTHASILSSPVVGRGSIAFGGIDHLVYYIPTTASLASSPWPMFRGDAAHTGQAKTTVLAPIIHTSTASETVSDGGQVTLAVIAEGAGPLNYSWSFNGNVIGTTESSLSFAMNSGVAGTYTVTVTNQYGSITSSPMVITEGAPPPPVNTSNGPGRIINLSARAYTGTGANTLIVGLIVGPGSGSKPILVRGIGPSLQVRGVKTFIDDPALTLYSGSTVIGKNDNWADDPSVPALTSSVGAVPFTTSLDTALVADLTSGGYTAHIVNGSSSKGAGGVALAEFYDGSTSVDESTPLLTNISARAHVGQGDQVLIVGFIIGGSSPVKVLIRGLGPQLTKQSVNGVLADPTIRLVNQADGSTVQINDNWGDAPNLSDIQTAMTQVGATTLDAGSKDSVILTTLSPGGYTAVVSGVNGASGVALAELFEVQ